MHDRRVHGERGPESVLAAALAGDHGNDHFQAQRDGQQDAQVGVWFMYFRLEHLCLNVELIIWKVLRKSF